MKRLAALGGVAAIIFGAYSLYWLFASNALQDAAGDYRKAYSDAGYGKLAWDNERVTGYPTHFSLRPDRTCISLVDRSTLCTEEGPVASALAIWPFRVNITLPETGVYNPFEGQEAPFRLGETRNITLHWSLSGLETLRLDISRFQYGSFDGALQADLTLNAENLWNGEVRVRLNDAIALMDALDAGGTLTPELKSAIEYVGFLSRDGGYAPALVIDNGLYVGEALIVRLG